MEREEKRKKMREIGIEQKKKKKEKKKKEKYVDDGEKMKILKRNVEVEEGRIERKGRKIELKGIEIVKVEKK